MSDSDHNPDDAEYSDNSSDSERRHSVISGRDSRNFDGSIVEEPYTFDSKL